MSNQAKAREITLKHMQAYRTGELGVGDTVHNAVTEALESQRKELEELREAKGLLPKCKVDQELFAANVTCRQQAQMIQYQDKTITDQKREIEDCVEGMAMQSALIKDLRKELADASVMISQLTGQYDNEVKELRELCEELLEGLRIHGMHATKCPRYKGTIALRGGELVSCCTCGLDALEAKAKERLK